ncbi:hypothetical protein KZ829_18110 [Actinoplanes hulinensis]|uniref:Uncharacterized protein n=1 Tax=Actinoplanes hulinensis TaxID=1144547 RepID=A0ABS7B3P9_9ACTN|nr:hypothetical protein [Actinoplanes hulinensis]MBW6435659.1 hypothetical protein [Actinoplanes hulinensis]
MTASTRGGGCTVTVVANGRLEPTVADDGVPPESWRPVVGIRSLRERAEEPGGTASAGPADGGWAVSVALSLTTCSQLPA